MSGGFFMNIPPEIEAELRRARERAEMSQESTHLEMRNFFHTLTEDQVMTLWRIFAALVHHDDPMQTYASAADFSGYLRSMYEFKFGKCPCGSDHELDFLHPPPVQEDEDDG